MVHRDIKPSNVLITPEGRVKLIDMGLARLRDADPAADDLTQSGVTLGTFDYISPEQARDPRIADVRSDIYSLGCTLFFMLTGRPPFPEGTVLQKLLQHQGDEPPEVTTFRPDVPEQLSRVMRKMMAKDPRRRYASSAELTADLLAQAEQIGLRPMSPASRVWLTPPQQTVPFFQRHLPWMAPVAALLCVVLLVDRYSAPRDDPAPPLIDSTAKELAANGAVAKKVAEKSVAKIDVVQKKKDVAAKEPLPSDKTSEPTAALPLDEPGFPAETARDPFAELRAPPFDAVPPGLMSDPLERGATWSRPLPEEPAKRSGVLIVRDDPAGPSEFSSLGDACALRETATSSSCGSTVRGKSSR